VEYEHELEKSNAIDPFYCRKRIISYIMDALLFVEAPDDQIQKMIYSIISSKDFYDTKDTNVEHLIYLSYAHLRNIYNTKLTTF